MLPTAAAEPGRGAENAAGSGSFASAHSPSGSSSSPSDVEEPHISQPEHGDSEELAEPGFRDPSRPLAERRRFNLGRRRLLRRERRGKSRIKEGPWTKLIALTGIAALLLAYIATANQLHWPPYTGAAGPPKLPVATKAPMGAFTDPVNGATNIYFHEQLHVSGTARNIPPGYKLDVFLQFVGDKRYYSAADPNIAAPLINGHWSSTIFIGEAQPIVLWLVSLSPTEVRLVNNEVAYHSDGYPTLPGTRLASIRFTAKASPATPRPKILAQDNFCSQADGWNNAALYSNCALLIRTKTEPTSR